MNKIAHFSRALIVSPEFAICLSAAAMIYFEPTWFTVIKDALDINPEKLKWIALAPIATCSYTFVNSKKLLFPDEDKKRILQAWPEYWSFRITVNVMLIYASLFALLGIASWFLNTTLYERFGFVFSLTALLGGLFTALSCFLAIIRVNEIFRT